jgi:hypothetical protein
MKIASTDALSKPAHVQLLPPSWGTLYELTKLPEDKLEVALVNLLGWRESAAEEILISAASFLCDSLGDQRHRYSAFDFSPPIVLPVSSVDD